MWMDHCQNIGVLWFLGYNIVKGVDKICVANLYTSTHHEYEIVALIKFI